MAATAELVTVMDDVSPVDLKRDGNGAVYRYIKPYKPERALQYRLELMRKLETILAVTESNLRITKFHDGFAMITSAYLSDKGPNFTLLSVEIEEYFKLLNKKPGCDVGLMLENKYLKCCDESNGKSYRPSVDIPLDYETEERIEKLKKIQYYCQICDRPGGAMKLKSTYYGHMGLLEHRSRMEKLNLGENDELQESECSVCSLVIYSEKDDGPHEHININDTVFPISARRLFLSSNNLYKKIDVLEKTSQEVCSQVDDYKLVLSDLENALKSTYGSCQAYLFGSRLSGLASRESDLDIFLDLDNLYNGIKLQDADAQARLINNTFNHLKASPDWDAIESIPYARTPIVKALHRSTGLKCDINCRNGLGVENTKLLLHITNIKPVAKSLILFLKRWTVLTRTDKMFSSYSLSILAIFFMQVFKHLPSLVYMRQQCQVWEKNSKVAGWECHFPKNLYIHVAKFKNDNIMELIRGFFTYYSTFDFERLVVCPLLGESLLKMQFENRGGLLPPELAAYRAHVARIPHDVFINPDRHMISRHVMNHPMKESFPCSREMCVQDPFDLTHNLTKAMRREDVKLFKSLCTKSANAMQHML